MRSLDELLERNDPAWPLVQSWVHDASNAVEVLAPVPSRGATTLAAIQVTTRSPMGAIAYHTGGLLIDHGWLRILGGGCDRMDGDLARFNGDLERGYSAFLDFAFTGDLQNYYGDYRWSGWEHDVASMSPDEGMSWAPPLFTKEGKDLANVSRKPVPMGELFGLLLDFARQLGDPTSSRRREPRRRRESRARGRCCCARTTRSTRSRRST